MVAFLEALVPGLRSLRPPIFAGIGWSVFVWLILSGVIPNQDNAGGWVAQAYSVGAIIGTPALLAAILVTIFIVGAVAQSIVEPTARGIGTLSNRFVRWIRNRRHSGSDRAGVLAAVAEIRADELRLRLEGRTLPYDDDVFHSVLAGEDREDLVARLDRELNDDPLDVLRDLDPDAYAELQRVRAERSVRLAVSFPLLAIAILLFFVSFVAGLIVLALSLVMIVRYSADLTDERERVLRLMLLRRGSTPAVVAVKAMAKYDLEEYVSAITKKKERAADDSAGGRAQTSH